MHPLALILLLAGVAAVLMVAELLLPAHGLLGITSLLCLAGAIATCFYLNRWAGLILLATVVLASPFLFNLGLQVWAKSPIGRRVILQPIETARAPAAVRIGQIGVAVTNLRPMGECDFSGHRLEALSELDIIPSGQKVKVIAIDSGRPTVRAVDDSVAASPAKIESGKETT
jgi:membrane-bound ClpP family serine protease